MPERRVAVELFTVRATRLTGGELSLSVTTPARGT